MATPHSAILNAVHARLKSNELDGFYWTEHRIPDPDIRSPLKPGVIFYGKRIVENIYEGWIPVSVGSFLYIDEELDVPCLAIKSNKAEMKALLKRLQLNIDGFRSLLAQNQDVMVRFGLNRTENDCPVLLRIFDVFREANWSDQKGFKIYFMKPPAKQTLDLIHGLLVLLGCRGEIFTNALRKEEPYTLIMNAFFQDFCDKAELNYNELAML
ncbi:hypothetical protein BM525_20575 (plasmid) [Alteromonas mediterranea]|uniref:hypothetical protein n=1 Tax=Alteromonas mediterranea TaxID=314275 RepID=UPI0009038DBE|nr:hypothetical protein [Alteromonas mediterranea]APE00123.1 hypothetical protein BM525_20575 [Alteromonas mediterranea]